MRLASLALLCAAALLLVVGRGCYTPDQPNCTYRCTAENASHCPADYECRADGYCHKKGTEGMCAYPAPPDLAPGPDLATPVDMATPPDMTTLPDGNPSDAPGPPPADLANTDR